MSLLRDLAAWVVAWADSPYSAWALALLAFAESSVFPIPPDTLLIALGLAAPELALFFALIATIGSVAGGVFGYWIGRYGGRPVLLRLFSESKVAGVQAMYQRYDVWAVFIAAFTPIPYKVFTIAAGVFDLDLKRFIIASLIGRGARFFLVGATLTFFGPSVQYFLTHYLELSVTILTVLLIGGFFSLRFVNRFLALRRPRQEIDAPTAPR